MKKLLFSILLFLITLLFLILNCGCVPKKEGSYSAGGSNGVLRDKGQGVCLDVDSGRMWQVERVGKFSSVHEAKRYAENLELGGHDDWRLPTKTELFDLHYKFFWKKNGNCNLKQAGEYFIVDDDESSLGHWETYFLCDPNYKYVKALGTKGFVRAVRP